MVVNNRENVKKYLQIAKAFDDYGRLRNPIAAGAIQIGERLCRSIESRIKVRKDVPFNSEWGEEKWNFDYRINRSEALETGTAPCKTECPSHISIPAYIKLAGEGKYKQALKLIKKDNPFPAVCGRICPALCEAGCTRGDFDEAIAIDDIKKFVAEKDLNEDERYIPDIKHDYTDKHIAVIGAGPAGP